MPGIWKCSPSVIDAWLERQCGDNTDLPLDKRLQQAQFIALREILHYAVKHSRWYARTLSNYDLDIDRYEDFRGLPCISGRDLQNHHEFLCISQSDVQRIVTLQTSGSTGVPKRLAFSEQDLARTRDFFAIGMSQLIQKGERLLVILPGTQNPDGVVDLLRRSLAASDITVRFGSMEKTVKDIYDDLQCWQPHCIVAAPHQLALLLATAEKDRQLLAALRNVKGILSSGDLLDKTLRKALQSSLGCHVLDHYGMTESCFGGGVECFAHDGYHMRELDLFLEILEPGSDEPARAGEVGEVVLTTLHREAMPLIRYRTGDAAYWLSGPCSCGSPLRRLAPVQGRYCLENGSYVLRQVPKGGFNARAFTPALS